jgi:hypothetical protein
MSVHPEPVEGDLLCFDTLRVNGRVFSFQGFNIVELGRKGDLERFLWRFFEKT